MASSSTSGFDPCPEEPLLTAPNPKTGSEVVIDGDVVVDIDFAPVIEAIEAIEHPIIAPECNCLIVDGVAVQALATSQGWYETTVNGLELVTGVIELPEECDERCAVTVCEPDIDPCFGCGECSEEGLFNGFIQAGGLK